MMRQLWQIACGLVGIGICGGCPQVASVLSGIQTPDSGTLAERLAADPGALEPDLPVAPDAEPVSDLTALTGCWGRVAGPEDVAVPGGHGVSIAARSTEVWRFSGDGRYRHETLIRADGQTLTLLMVEEGQVTLSRTGTICLNMQRLGVRDLLGELALEPVSEQAARTSICWNAATTDAQLVLRGPLHGDETAHASPVAYRRVSCP